MHYVADALDRWCFGLLMPCSSPDLPNACVTVMRYTPHPSPLWQALTAAFLEQYQNDPEMQSIGACYCDMTQSHVWLDPFTRETGHILQTHCSCIRKHVYASHACDACMCMELPVGLVDESCRTMQINMWMSHVSHVNSLCDTKQMRLYAAIYQARDWLMSRTWNQSCHQKADGYLCSHPAATWMSHVIQYDWGMLHKADAYVCSHPTAMWVNHVTRYQYVMPNKADAYACSHPAAMWIIMSQDMATSSHTK